MKIKKGDTVMIRSGKDKGKTGTVVKTMAKTEQIIIDGINIATKHQKPTRRGQQGQLVQKPMPVHLAKVGLVVDGKAVRVGYLKEGDSKAKKVRVARPTGKKV